MEEKWKKEEQFREEKLKQVKKRLKKKAKEIDQKLQLLKQNKLKVSDSDLFDYFREEFKEYFLLYSKLVDLI